jgi:hypothetical protein
MLQNFFFENHSVFEKKWKNTVRLDTPQMTIWRMYIACWIPKRTDTHSKYAVRIAFLLQQPLITHLLKIFYTFCETGTAHCGVHKSLQLGPISSSNFN